MPAAKLKPKSGERRKYLSRKFYEEIRWQGKTIRLHPEDVDLIVEIANGTASGDHRIQMRSYRLFHKLKKFTGSPNPHKTPLICWFAYAANLVSLRSGKEMMLGDIPNITLQTHPNAN